MWSPLALLVFVGVAFAANNPGWKPNTEYIYEVRGRTVSSLNEVENQYSGIQLRASLTVQPSEDKLRLKVLNPEYAEIHTVLPGGWQTEIPESELSYKPLPMTNKPFEVKMRNGVIRDLIVEKDVPEWEANIIKSFVSQIQLDTRGENLVKSSMNILPEEGQNNGVFKVLEDTVTGITETTYDIHPIPEYTLQSRPWLVPFPHLKGDGQIIEVLKTKDFTKSAENPAYYEGLSNFGVYEPASNQLGQVMSRTSLGHAVITGTLNRFTVQFSETVNKIKVRPTPYVKQRGEVVSYIRIKLTTADQQKNQLPEISSPVHLGRLVYSYGKQNSQDNKVSQRSTYQLADFYKLGSSESSESSEEKINHIEKHRHPRSLYRNKQGEQMEGSWGKQKLSETPRHPMLPYNDGYYGMSIKQHQKINIVEEVKRICEEIGQEMEQQMVPREKVLSKFALLSKLIALMDEQELKQVSQALYPEAQSKPQVWQTLRDATAEAGTGPALLVIKEWIESGKVQNYQAAHVFMAMLNSVRQPTEEYIRTCYDIVVKQLEKQHPVLNETALLGFSELLHRVYVDQRVSHRDYPSHAYGNFATQEGKTFVQREYIPYLTQQLREAISKADSRKIDNFIRSMAQLGHPDIVYVFEPFLEGRQQVSQYQRLLMVVALRKVMHVDDKLARNILYRMYQNVGETSEIRVAAAHMLLQSGKYQAKIPSDMIQRMAEFTNVDTNHHVCAAVKSLIEEAAQLEAPEFAHLKSVAEAARPLLTKQQFGINRPLSILKEWVSEEEFSFLERGYSHETSEGSGIPNLFLYYLREKNNGYHNRLVTIQAMTSNLRNLINVLSRKTQWYQEAEDAQKESSKQSAWSSPNVARYLNLRTEELEQLEGSLRFGIGEWYEHLNFDNQTIEHNMPKMIERISEELRKGKSMKFSKFVGGKQYLIAFPTEMGLPFVHNFEAPMFVKVEAEIRANSQPEIISNGKIQTPEQIESDVKVHATFTHKYSGELGFFCPFNHKHYSAGYDRSRQYHVPIRSETKFDFKTKKVEVKVQPLGQDKKQRLYEESSWPYVSHHDITDIKTNEERKSTHVIRKPIQHSYEKEFGQKWFGMAFRVQYETDNKFPASLWQKLTRRDDEDICYHKTVVEYDPISSKNKEMVLEINVDEKYIEKTEEDSNETTNQGKAIEKLLKLRGQQNEQQKQELIKQSSTGIRNAKVYTMQGHLKFEGQQTVQYKFMMGVAKSNVDPRSRTLAYFKKESKTEGSKPFEMALASKVYMPNTNGLNMDYAMKFDPTSTAEIEIDFDEQLPSNNKMNINMKLRKSEERKQWLMSGPEYQKCQREMQQGNNQLRACANVTQMANLLDRVMVEIKYQNMRQGDVSRLLTGFNCHSWGRKFEIEKQNGKSDEVTVKARFSPDLQSCNVSVKGQDVYGQMDNIRINDYVRQIVVVQPVFHAGARLQGKIHGLKTYRPICTMDQTKGQTFDGTTYPLSISKAWTVLMQYVPLRSQGHSKGSVEEQLRHELYNAVVLARQNQQEPSKKDVKITVSLPKTNGKLMEITLEPSADQSYPKCIVDGQEVQVSEKQAYAKFNGLLEVYGLPNRELKVDIKDGFYIIYDGSRVKITATTGHLRNQVRGLCGNFNGEEASDLVTPNNCVVRDPKEFIATYTVLNEGQQNNEIMNLKARAQKSHCAARRVPMYVNVISKSENNANGQERQGCLRFQTRYITENGQVCFTKRSVPVCKPGCQSVGQKHEEVEVHCVKAQNSVSLWQSQIDKGANPDFSLKKTTKTIRMEVPRKCQM